MTSKKLLSSRRSSRGRIRPAGSDCKRIRDRHYLRKHGKSAYYGQPKERK
jgi:hypothetical protein